MGARTVTLMVGTTIGRYRIVDQLGRGATGTVYQAVDQTLHRDVAIKVLHADLGDAEVLRRFHAEATILARLNHPEIATIYELVESESDLLMVMELVRGETLEQLAARVGPMPPERAAYVLDKVLAGLTHAHGAGVVHRDLKPANIMVTGEGGVKIMDFGVARARGAERKTLTGSMVGTPGYIAPEQVLGDAVDERADLYAVGVVLYRLLTGALPFPGESAVTILQRQMSDGPSPLGTFREDLPPWCEEVVQRALARQPADRFHNAVEFRDALGRATGTATIDLGRAFALWISEAAGQAPPGADSAAAAAAPLHDPPAAHPSTIAWQTGPARWRFRAPIAALTLAVAAILYVGAPSRKRGAPVAPPAPPASPGTGLAGRLAAALPAGERAAPKPPPAPEEFRPRRNPSPDRPPPATAPAAASFPVLVFDTKALVPAGDKRRERDAQLILSDGTVTITPDDDVRRPLHSVPYGSVSSISYSRGPDPMWNSPRGRQAIVHAGGGALRKLGISVERHWIALQLNTTDDFVILRVAESSVDQVLRALAERTGRNPQLVSPRTRGD